MSLYCKYDLCMRKVNAKSSHNYCSFHKDIISKYGRKDAEDIDLIIINENIKLDEDSGLYRWVGKSTRGNSPYIISSITGKIRKVKVLVKDLIQNLNNRRARRKIHIKP